MRKSIIIFILLLTVGFAGVILILQTGTTAMPDIVAVNDAVMTAVYDENSVEAFNILSYILISEFERMQQAERTRILIVAACLSAFIIVAIAASIGFYAYINHTILAPFRKLQSFAGQIAAGNLDIPLTMDRNNQFGAFTESFDLMREELHTAKENERLADQSKKELVASLSHDIKTPVASIKAITELMLVMTKDEKEKKQLETINEKAEQINILITNMFHSTLEELQALSVTVGEYESTAIFEALKKADYKGLVKSFSIPNCVINADLTRLTQVFDNILGNSYKYAETDIEVISYFEKDNIIIEISDFGPGVLEDEIPFLTGKFYRGKNSEAKSGYGLGLYISKYFLEQMSGSVVCENRTNGFSVRISLELS